MVNFNGDQVTASVVYPPGLSSTFSLILTTMMSSEMSPFFFPEFPVLLISLQSFIETEPSAVVIGRVRLTIICHLDVPLMFSVVLLRFRYLSRFLFCFSFTLSCHLLQIRDLRNGKLFLINNN